MVIEVNSPLNCKYVLTIKSEVKSEMLYVRRLKGHKLLVGRSIEQTIRSIPVQLHQSLENIMLYGYYTGMFMQLVRGDVEQPDAQQDRDGKRSFFGFSDSQEDVDLE